MGLIKKYLDSYYALDHEILNSEIKLLKEKEIKELTIQINDLKEEISLIKFPNGRLISKYVFKGALNYFVTGIVYNYKNKNYILPTDKTDIKNNYTFIRENNMIYISLEDEFFVIKNENIIRTDSRWRII